MSAERTTGAAALLALIDLGYRARHARERARG